MGHHYVPQFYLRGFEECARIWAHDWTRKKSFYSDVKSLANENGMYSEEIESFLANEIEMPALKALIKVRRLEDISAIDRFALARYIVFLMKRVPEGRERFLRNIPSVADKIELELFDEIDVAAATDLDFAVRAADLKKHITSIIEKQKNNLSPKLWYSTFSSETGKRLIAAILSMKWEFISSPSIKFLTSDNPVFYIQSRGISHINSELSLPLSSLVALRATHRTSDSKTFINVSAAEAREINRRTALNSTRFLYSSANESWILPFVTKWKHKNGY